MIGITERGDAALDLSWKPWVEAGKPAILITKAPSKLIDEITPGMNVIVHCTITGYGGFKLEPGVFTPAVELANYLAMVDKLGNDRVVLRVDPIIPYEPWLGRSWWVSQNAVGRVRISFMDLYPHVRDRMKKAGIKLPYDTFHAPLENRIKAWRMLGEPEICGEPDMFCTGCVSLRDLKTLGIDESNARTGGFQRKMCQCLSVKKELLKSKEQCGHGCLYCYWKG